MPKTVRLRATHGADEANFSGYPKPFRVDNDGCVDVPEEAVEALLSKGGFQLAQPEVIEVPADKVAVRHLSDPAASCCHGEPDERGIILVPVGAVAALEAHGFARVEIAQPAPAPEPAQPAPAAPQAPAQPAQPAQPATPPPAPPAQAQQKPAEAPKGK